MINWAQGPLALGPKAEPHEGPKAHADRRPFWELTVLRSLIEHWNIFGFVFEVLWRLRVRASCQQIGEPESRKGEVRGKQMAIDSRPHLNQFENQIEKGKPVRGRDP